MPGHPSAHVTVNLDRPSWGVDEQTPALRPLSVPDILRLESGSLSADLLDDARFEVSSTLRAGTYGLTLSEGQPCQLEIPEGCGLDSLISAVVGEHGLPIVERIEGSFSRPVVFHNILSTLVEVQSLFEDRLSSWLRDKVATIIDSTLAGTALGDLLSAIGRSLEDGAASIPLELIRHVLQLSGEGIDALGAIHVASFSATPELQRSGALHLRFAFTGHALLSERLRIPFNEVKLASVVLPTLHATIEDLLSDSPLGSASFNSTRVPYPALVRTYARMVSSFEVKVSIAGRMPTTCLSGETFARSTLQATVSVPQECTIQGYLSGQLDGDVLSFGAEELVMAFGEDRLTLGLEGKADLDEVVELIADVLENGLGDEDLTFALRALDRTPHAGSTADLEITIAQGSRVGALDLAVSSEHPLAAGRAELEVNARDVEVSGRLAAVFDGRARTIIIDTLDLALSGKYDVDPSGEIADGVSRWVPTMVRGTFESTTRSVEGEPLDLRFSSTAVLELHGEKRFEPVPELSLDSDLALINLAASTEVTGRARVAQGEGGASVMNFEGTRARVSVATATVEIGDVRVTLPTGTDIEAIFDRSFLSATGLGEAQLRLSWDMHARSPRLSSGEDSVEIFVEPLRSMEVVAQVGRGGRLSFSGGDGLYDGAFVNALINPLAEQAKWMEILGSEEASDRLLEALALLSPEFEDLLHEVRGFLERAREVLADEGIETPADIIPRARMARVLSRVLAGHTGLEDRLAAIIRQVTEANGLDRHGVEAIASEIFPDHDYQFELDRALRWLDHVLSPGTPLPPPVIREVTAPVHDPRFAADLTEIPSASVMYGWVREGEAISGSNSAVAASLAAWMSADQLAYLIEHGGDRWRRGDLARMKYISQLKGRIRLIRQGYGGAGYAPQGTAISFFLADVIDSDRVTGGLGPVPGGVFGPADVAVLLQAGLANVSHSRTVQINQRMLFDYARRRSSLFFLGVLSQMGMGSPRVLTGVLLAFLNQDQEHLREPCDMPATLSELLGISIPDRRDYMAGGRWAKESYYQAVMRTAEYLLAEADRYLAIVQHLQDDRHAPSAPPKKRRKPTRRERDARAAIEAADAIAARCTFTGEPAGPVEEARAAYDEAFAACRKLVAWEPVAFQRPWLKAFWFRNHEALMVRSVVRNVQDDVDRVRTWLDVRSGGRPYQSEQDLVELVVDVLYHFPEDRAKLLADPLIRLLLSPPSGQYAFTIVSAMGVVTEGRRGRELEDAFARLEARYGVKLVRSDTATAETLVYNAQKIVEAIEEVDGPYGLIGYSQGCANVLMAESLLRRGTPEQQRLLDDLRSRNFLFSAVNGSAHGSCGNEKFLAAMVEGEAFLKFYQGMFSGSLIRGFQKVLNALLENPQVTHIMGSVDSLSHEGVVSLTRDGEFLGEVPTTTVRGVVTPPITPEALDFLSNVITRQVKGALHDTQVTLVSAIGHSDRVVSPHGEVLKRCDIGSYAQSTHHWSPLLYASDFVTTERDRARAIYDFPKDRHIFPWVELNARFGLIEVT